MLKAKFQGLSKKLIIRINKVANNIFRDRLLSTRQVAFTFKMLPVSLCCTPNCNCIYTHTKSRVFLSLIFKKSRSITESCTNIRERETRNWAGNVKITNRIHLRLQKVCHCKMFINFKIFWWCLVEIFYYVPSFIEICQNVYSQKFIYAL